MAFRILCRLRCGIEMKAINTIAFKTARRHTPA